MKGSIFEVIEDYPYINYLRDVYGDSKIDDKTKERIKMIICHLLKLKYESCLPVVPVNPQLDLPGGPQRGPGKYDMPEGDDFPKEPIDTRVTLWVNEQKIRILNQALSLGCSWAKKELLKLKDLNTIDKKELFKLLE